MNNRLKVCILILGISIVASLIWLWSGLSGFIYGQKVEMTFSFIGAIIGGIATLIALYITVKQTREIQKENRNQIYISNINEKIRDHIKMLDATNKSSNSLEKIYEQYPNNYNDFPEYVMQLKELGDEYTPIAAMYLNENIAMTMAKVFDLYWIMIATGKNIVMKNKLGEECTDLYNLFEHDIEELIEDFTELSKVLHNLILHLYFDKYKKLDNK